MYQGGVAKLDKKTGKVQTWSVPKEWQTDATQQSFASPTFSHVDGKVWVKNSDRAQILRLEPATSKWENFGTFTDPETKRTIGSYGINADHNNNLYMLDFNSGNIGMLDGATKKLEILSHGDSQFAAAPGQRRRAEPLVVRRIRRQRHRHARSEDQDRSRNGPCRRRGRIPMTWSSTRTARPGPDR